MFSTKNIFPTIVRRGVYTFLVPRNGLVRSIDIQKCPEGLQFYNLFQKKLVRITNPYTVERTFYLQKKKLEIYLQGRIVEPLKLPNFIATGTMVLDNLLERRVDKLSYQIDNETLSSTLLDAKLKHSVQKHADEWGIHFDKITCILNDKDDVDTDEYQFTRGTIYM